MCWIPVREKKIVFRWNPAHFRATAPNLRSFKNGAEIGPNRKSGCSIADQLTREEGWPLPSHLTILCHSPIQFTLQKTSNLTWQTLFSILQHDEFSTFAAWNGHENDPRVQFQPPRSQFNLLFAWSHSCKPDRGSVAVTFTPAGSHRPTEKFDE